MKVEEQIGVNISYRIFYQPVQGPYGPISSSNRRRRQLHQEFTMDFTGPPGTLTNLNGSVTYNIQVAAIAHALYSDQEAIGNRSVATVITTLTGSKLPLINTVITYIITMCIAPTLPRNLSYGDLT